MIFELDPNGKYMQEGYWGNHTPEDDCVTIRLPKINSGILQRVKRFHAEKENSKLASSLLTDFFRLSSRDLIRRLKTGETFLGENYPLGTIIKFEEERLSLNYRTKTSRYFSEGYYIHNIYWGVIANIDYPAPSENILLAISNGFIQYEQGRAFRSKFFVYDHNLEIDKVIHKRTAKNKHGANLESFKRVLAVDIWSIGKGVKKSTKESSLSRFVKLALNH